MCSNLLCIVIIFELCDMMFVEKKRNGEGRYEGVPMRSRNQFIRSDGCHIVQGVAGFLLGMKSS